MSPDHELGGVSTDLKLSIVEQYLKSYTTALRNKYPHLWYIDAFAGTGERTKWSAAQEGDLFEAASPEKVDRFRGSARIAIEIKPAFDRLIFVEQKPKHFEALKKLKKDSSFIYFVETFFSPVFLFLFFSTTVRHAVLEVRFLV